jgi:hypothetical protein
LLKSRELIGGVHGFPDHIFGQTRFGSRGAINNAAGYAKRFWDSLLLGKFRKCGKATASGNHLVFVALLDDNEVVQ